MGDRMPTVAALGQEARQAVRRRPCTSDHLIPRERVRRALDEAADATVVCLEAPGGYGKTTAVVQWLDRDPRPVVWVGVRAAAPDAAWVAQAILDGVADAGLIAQRPVLAGSPGPATWHLDTLPLVEDLLAAAREPFVVVVDDAGEVTGDAWDCLVESIATSLPGGAQLVLTTREALPAPLWRLASRGQVVVVGQHVLALDEAETRSLLASLGIAATQEQVRALLRQTQGWPVAVYLEALAMGAVPAPRSPADTGASVPLAQYLRTEVIGRLSEEDRRFLSRVSVLETLDEESCDALTASTGSLERLRRLALANRLLAALDPAAERFRMHPLLADALEQQLREADPAAWRAAHTAASGVEAGRGDQDSAVHHAKVAQDDDRLSDLVWSEAPTLLATGRFAVLDRWLAGLDDARVSEHCGLALSAAWLASHHGDMARTNRMALVAAERAAREDPGFVLDAGLLEATIGAAGLAAIEAGARAFIEGKPVDDPWQTLGHFLLGVALFLRDETTGAVAALRESYRIAVAHDLPVMSAHALAGLADIAFDEAEVPRALSLIREARELAAQHRLDTITTTGPVFTTSAVGYVHEGRFADARREATRALRLTAGMRLFAPWHAVQGRLALAQVFAALGDPERARILADEAAESRGPSTTSPRLDRLAEQTLGRLSAVSAGLDGSSSLTTAEIRVLQYLPTHLTFAQIADELFVSRHTVKTQALSTYRKLGVHTRTEAIASARRAGLLPPR